MKKIIYNSLKKITLILLVIFITNSIYAVDLFNRPQKSSEKSGKTDSKKDPFVVEYKKLYDNGLIEIKGQTMFGKKIGIWYFYHENGKLAEEHLYFDGEKDFNVKLFDEEGIITSSGKVLNGKQDGEWNFYDEKGLILVKMTFKKGVRDGIFVAYSENGAPIVAGVFKNNDLVEIDSIR